MAWQESKSERMFGLPSFSCNYQFILCTYKVWANFFSSVFVMSHGVQRTHSNQTIIGHILSQVLLNSIYYWVFHYFSSCRDKIVSYDIYIVLGTHTCESVLNKCQRMHWKNVTKLLRHALRIFRATIMERIWFFVNFIGLRHGFWAL